MANSRVSSGPDERRADLDWLRVGAFGVLILYHIGMFYVSWDWHVKSGHAPVEALEIPMILVNGWRLPLLFFISGVALRFALDKRRPISLLRHRNIVLFLPVLFGMYVVCAPQAWHELIQGGYFDGTLGAFYADYVRWPWASPTDWPMITPTWNHLWFVLYILVYSNILMCGRIIGGGRIERVIDPIAASRSVQILVPTIHVVVMLAFWDSVGHAQTIFGDWYNLTVSFLIMTLGFHIAKQEAFWARLKALRGVFAVASLILSIVMVVLHQGDVNQIVSRILRVVQGWFVIWALLGWGQVFLCRSSPLLHYLSGAVFTYYILHQTVIIMVGVPLARLNLPLFVESLVLTVSTIFFCWVGYEWVAKRIGRFGLLLGARRS